LEQHRAANRLRLDARVLATRRDPRRLRHLQRTALRVFQDGPAAFVAFLHLQNVPAPLDMPNPYPRLNISPFTIPLQVQIARVVLRVVRVRTSDAVCEFRRGEDGAGRMVFHRHGDATERDTVHRDRRLHLERILAQVARARTDLAAGRTVDNIEKTGSVQSRLDQYFDPTGFANSEDH